MSQRLGESAETGGPPAFECACRHHRLSAGQQAAVSGECARRQGLCRLLRRFGFSCALGFGSLGLRALAAAAAQASADHGAVRGSHRSRPWAAAALARAGGTGAESGGPLAGRAGRGLLLAAEAETRSTALPLFETGCPNMVPLAPFVAGRTPRGPALALPRGAGRGIGTSA